MSTIHIDKYITNYVCQPHGTDFTKAYLISFILGFIFGPWHYGVAWLLIYNIIYWILDYLISFNYSNCWSWEGRIGIFFFSLFGFITSRTLWGKKVLERGTIPLVNKKIEENESPED
jgi:hypothetical protein